MLDNVRRGPSDDEYEACLRIAKGAFTLLTNAVQDDPGRLLAILGAMTERALKDIDDPDQRALKDIDDPDQRAELTLEFIETLATQLGLATKLERL